MLWHACVLCETYLGGEVAMHDAVRVQVAHAPREVARQLDPHRPRQLYRLVSQELLQAASVDELEQTRSSGDTGGILATRTMLSTIQTMAETENHGGDHDHCIHKGHGGDNNHRQKETCKMVETSTKVDTVVETWTW